MAVRLATLHDLSATARIASRGFAFSPWNAFYRPYAEQYPQDVETAYKREQQEALVSGKKLFTVVEVASMSKESDSRREVVGFAIWNQAEGLERIQKDLVKDTIAWLFWQFRQIYESLTGYHDRSVEEHREKLLFGASERAVDKYFKGWMELDNMAIDPKHFRHGYGTILCRHGMDLAMKNKTPIGIIAAESGKPLYDKLGFDTIVEKTVEDERPGKEASVEFWVQKWVPKL